MYKIEYHRLVVSDDFKRIPEDARKRILRTIVKKLSLKPDVFGKPLRYELKGFFRLRIGDHRVIYSVKKEIVTVFVLHVGMRKNFLVYLEAAKRLKLL